MRLIDKQAQTGAFGSVATGFRFLYREGAQNYCPGCNGRNWIIGRMTAECSFCATALPLSHAHDYGYFPRLGQRATVQPRARGNRRRLRLVA